MRKAEHERRKGKLNRYKVVAVISRFVRAARVDVLSPFTASWFLILSEWIKLIVLETHFLFCFRSTLTSITSRRFQQPWP
ncbi:hypothetical protein PsorP6_015632 [Peronosclerospora sorghi]|uniref:Uncharacterized protein n=1 Tax=Peronosclerospora sorghi TaxID=230839 RepID=A0ACC0WPU4_9STRA|nr:hypothetical protein PsorP6_015632 [Peronosclerospora sorghi]